MDAVICSWTHDCKYVPTTLVRMQLSPIAMGREERGLTDDERSIEIPVCGRHREAVEGWLRRR